MENSSPPDRRAWWAETQGAMAPGQVSPARVSCAGIAPGSEAGGGVARRRARWAPAAGDPGAARSARYGVAYRVHARRGMRAGRWTGPRVARLITRLTGVPSQPGHGWRLVGTLTWPGGAGETGQVDVLPGHAAETAVRRPAVRASITQRRVCTRGRVHARRTRSTRYPQLAGVSGPVSP